MDYKYFNQQSRKQRFLLKLFSPLNILFNKLNWPVAFTCIANRNSDMITLEQRINLFHLVQQVIINNVDGEFVETGSFTGATAIQIQDIITHYDRSKQLHIYDKFNLDSNPYSDIKQKLISNFEQSKVRLPIIHEGFFNETIPSELPEKIAFLHIDCGDASQPDVLKDRIVHILQSCYTRMSKNAVGILMDYYDAQRSTHGMNPNPGVKLACDQFFADKPEKVYVLYGNQFSHGYFVKQ